jgi:hypothetical protein
MARNVLKDNQDILKNELAFRVITEADDREFQRQMSDMDIGYAMQVADSAAKAASQRQVISGAGQVISAVTDFASKPGAFNSSTSGEANLDDDQG